MVLTIVNRDVKNEPLQNIIEPWLDIRLNVESRSYQLSEEQLKQILCGEITVDELIERGEVNERQD